LKILYVTSKGSIHDYRFLKKLVNDYRVLLFHCSEFEMTAEIGTLNGLEIISRKPRFKPLPLLSELAFFKKIVNDFKPDIVHTGYVWKVGVLAAFAGVHPHLSMPWGSDVLTEPDSKFIVKKLVNKVFRTCDHIQCDADFVKSKIISDYTINPEKITVFPWGIDLEMFKKSENKQCRANLNIPHDSFVIIFNRHLEDFYGVEYLMNAFRDFAADKNNVLLLIVAEGTMKSAIREFIGKNNLTDKVRIMGRVSNAELPAILNCSDIYISPSFSDGTSLSLLEAMACGMGIVVTDVPAITEWVSGDNGFVVPRKNTGQITAALQEYYSNRNLIAKHGEKNIKIAKERADWDNNYKKLKEIYNRLKAN
jgi:glycosyltransferase involved in cell wall biosynthesis